MSAAPETTSGTKCPPLLAAVLKRAQGWQHKSTNHYEEFLHAADAAVRDSASFFIPVHAEYCLKYGAAMDSSQLQLAQASVPNNATLISIYKHYTTLRMKYLPVKSKEKANNGSENLNFYELEIFFREFNVVPRLLSREDLKLLWRRCSYERIRQGKVGIKTLDLEEFKDFIVRVAVATYSKPGMHFLIKATTGEMPSQAEKVEYFAKYLQLDNPHYVKAIIVKSRNGFDDEEVRVRSLLKDELKQRGLNRIISLGQPDDGSLAVPTIGAMSTLSAIAGNEELPPPKPFTKDSKRYKDLQRPPVSSLLPEHIQQMLQNPGFDDELQDYLGFGHNDFGYTDKDEDDAFKTVADESSVGSFAIKGVDKKLFEAAFIYSPNLKKLLAPFCDRRMISLAHKDDMINTESPFMDLGELHAGTKVKVIYIVKNATRDFFSLDVVARGIDSPDVQIMTMTAPMSPGMSRSIQLTFTVTPGYRSVIGYLDIHFVRARQGPDVRISCPLYFEVNPQSAYKSTNEPLCTIRTLPDLLHKYCGVQRSLHVSFSRTFEKQLEETRRIEMSAKSAKSVYQARRESATNSVTNTLDSSMRR